jgi:signal transduction histidine kinase
MPPVAARVCLAVLAGLQILILVFRFSRCLHKVELTWFLLLILALTVRNLVPGGVTALVLSTYCFIWILARYLAQVGSRRRNSVLYLSLVALVLMHFVLGIMGLLTTLPFLILSVFFLILFSAFPIKLLYDLYRKTRFWLFFYLLIAALLLVVSMGYELLATGTLLPDPRLSFWLSLAALLGTFYLLVEESYLSGEGLQGLFARLVLQERRLQSTYSRLEQTENTLLLQDRLIAAGVLAAGAVHEFKGTLTTISAAAEFGVKTREASGKDESLALIREQADLGRQAVGDFLDRLIQQGRAQPVCLRLREELRPMLNLLRSGLRREGIRLTWEFGASSRLHVRKGELEQVLLNLVRNASDNLKKNPASGEKTISITSYREADRQILDVRDNGGGVPISLGNSIFEYTVSENRSTGLGLYLARILVERNGGSLDYLPLRQGSCFRMVFSANDIRYPTE